MGSAEPTPEPAAADKCKAPLSIVMAAIGTVWFVVECVRIVTDRVVPWDSKNQFYAFFRFLASALHAGATPFWNPYHYGGHPSIADPQSFIFSPLFVAWAVFDAEPSMRAFDFVISAHLLAGALSIGAIGWRARWPTSACVLAAVLFMLGGIAAGRLQHTGMVLSYALFPTALLMVQIALSRRSYAFAAAAGLLLGLLVLGRNQAAFLLCFLLAAMTAATFASVDHPWQHLRNRLPILAVIGAVGFALACIPILLTLQLTALSNRPAIALDDALLGSLHPANLATLAAADVFGTHGPHYFGPGAATVPEVRRTDDSFNYLFVGAAPTMIVVWLGIASGGAFRRNCRVIAAAMAFAIAYMLGRHTPVFGVIFAWAPGADLFRRPVDAGFVLMVTFALLTGELLAGYVREGPSRLLVLPTVFIVIGMIAVVVSAVLLAARSEQAMHAIVAIASAVLIAGLAALLLATARSRKGRAFAAALVAALSVGELAWWNAAFRLNAEARAHYSILEQPTGQDAIAVAVIERALREAHAAGRRPRVEVIGMGGPWQNLAMVRGWEAINGYNPLRIGAYDRLVAPGEENWRASMRRFPASFDSYDCALARTLGLELIVLGRPIEEVLPLGRRPPVAEMLLAGPRVWIYRMQNQTPRITFSTQVDVADTDADTSDRLPYVPVLGRVLIDDDTPPSHRYDPAEVQATNKARLTAWLPDRIEILTEATTSAVLTLHSTFYPGWIAEIDGKRATILRADILFRAIEVPPGRHQVVFRFAPLSLDNLRDALSRVLGSSQ